MTNQTITASLPFNASSQGNGFPTQRIFTAVPRGLARAVFEGE